MTFIMDTGLVTYENVSPGVAVNYAALLHSASYENLETFNIWFRLGRTFLARDPR